MRTIAKLIIFILAAGSIATVSAQTYKIKQRVTMAGQQTESTVYVKGPRQRTESGGFMGMGADVATVEQCDLKRNLQINDKKKLYSIEPFAVDESTDVVPAAPAAPAGKSVRGGTITVTSNTVDTGERKQMFGLTARRIKTTMTMQSSPDACSKVDTRMETDGWYVDLPQFSCPVRISGNLPVTQGSPGCKDRMVIKNSGSARLGFPLELNQKMMSVGSEQAFTQTIETLDFSRADLADSLFDIPSGYTLAKNSQDIYGMPDISSIIRSGQDVPEPNTARRSTVESETAIGPKRPGVRRIGVLMPSNKTDESLSPEELRSYLVEQLSAGNIEAVPVSSEAEARSADCDFVLSSDVSKFKQSAASKIGGVFGKVTGTDTSAARSYEAQFEFKLASVADGRKVLENKASKKTSGDADSAIRAVMDLAIAMVSGALR